MDYEAYAPDESPEEEQATLPPLAIRFVQVFFSPEELFGRLKERPVWFGALVVGALLVALSTLLTPPELFVETLRRQSLENGQDLPAALESSANLIRIFGVVFGAVGWFLITAFFAGVITVIFGFLFGDQVRYVQYLSVMAHAYLVAAVGGLFMTPLRITARNLELRLTLGTLTPFLPDGYFSRLLGWLELFGLWAWVLVGVGVAAMNPKRSTRSAVGVVLVIPVLIAAVIAIFR